MKNTIIIIISIIIIVALAFGACFWLNSETKSSEYNVENITNNIASSNTTNNIEKSDSKNIINELNNISIGNSEIDTKAKSHTIEEKEIASFSTNLKGDEARRNNIRITCNTINGTTIAPGETFSFNKIVGSPSADKGYMDITCKTGSSVPAPIFLRRIIIGFPNGPHSETAKKRSVAVYNTTKNPFTL